MTNYTSTVANNTSNTSNNFLALSQNFPEITVIYILLSVLSILILYYINKNIKADLFSLCNCGKDEPFKSKIKTLIPIYVRITTTVWYYLIVASNYAIILAGNNSLVSNSSGFLSSNPEVTTFILLIATYTLVMFARLESITSNQANSDEKAPIALVQSMMLLMIFLLCISSIYSIYSVYNLLVNGSGQGNNVPSTATILTWLGIVQNPLLISLFAAVMCIVLEQPFINFINRTKSGNGSKRYFILQLMLLFRSIFSISILTYALFHYSQNPQTVYIIFVILVCTLIFLRIDNSSLFNKPSELIFTIADEYDLHWHQYNKAYITTFVLLILFVFGSYSMGIGVSSGNQFISLVGAIITLSMWLIPISKEP